MSHRPVLLTRAPRRHPDLATAPLPVPIPSVLRVLDAHRHRLFAQRLAVLIERIRAANLENAADEH